MNNYLKISVLTALMMGSTACSTFQGNANNTKILKARCIAVVPLAVGEVDANILRLSGQICKQPQSAGLWQQLAQQFFALAKYDKAVQAANTTLKLQPDNADAKDIALRSGLKITEKSLTQMKGNMQFLHGEAWSDANQVAGQISRARAEKPLQLQALTTTNAFEMKKAKKTTAKKPVAKSRKSKRVSVKKATSPTKNKTLVAKPASKPKPSNPFASFN